MKKYVFLFMVMTLGLLSCSDDDKPVIPDMDKLVQVVCTKNGSDMMFTVNVSYKDEGQIVSFDYINGKKIPFIYVDNKITEISPSEDIERVEYLMNGKVIYSKSVMKNNPSNKEIYTSDEYKYQYAGASLVSASLIMKWPKEGGNEYDSQAFPNEETYTWENGNVTLFTREKKRIEYKYSTTLIPRNFPWRVIPSFNPTGFDVLSPINQLYGNPGRNLPESAYSYDISGNDATTAEYTYHYSTTGEYITSMTILEKITPANGAVENNSYEYSFQYR